MTYQNVTRISLLVLLLKISVLGQFETNVHKDTYLRAEPDSAAKVLARLPNGTSIELLIVATTKGWYPVRVESKLGWVDSRHVLRTYRQTVRGSGVEFWKVSAEKTKLRSKATVNSTVLLVFPEGAELEKDSVTLYKNWFKVELSSGVVGWIPKSDLVLIREQ